MKKNVIYLPVIIFLLNFSVGGTQASITEDAADFLVEIGENALKGGDLTTAIHEFSKALMISPDHQKAKFYLKQYRMENGLYSTTRTKTAQIGNMARDIRDYQDKLADVQAQRFSLEKRVDLLEDAIERKGDHKLLKDIEDYYRQSAFYDVDENLPVDNQLAALKNKHEEFKEYSFDKDRVQDRTLTVMQELLDYREDHLQDAKSAIIEYEIALAQDRRDLLAKVDRLKRLRSEYDTHRQESYDDAKSAQQLEQQISRAQEELRMLYRQHGADLTELKRQVETLEKQL